MEQNESPHLARGKCALFGGSFDPVHRGHLEMARTAREMLSLDQVWFVPCQVSPFKTGTEATGPQRLEMLTLALEELGFSWARVSDVELRREGPSYSWETAAEFREAAPEVAWSWILGTDQWEAIDRWAEPEKLREGLHFIVMTRHGETVRQREGWSHTPVLFSHPASSSAIRADFSAHETWLTPGVGAFVRANGLYHSTGLGE